MMRVEELRELFDYGWWANKRLFPVVSQLTPEQFTRHIGGQFASVRDLLVHMASAEWRWLGRCGGAERGPALNPADYPTAASVLEKAAQVEAAVGAFLAGLTEDDLSRIVEYAGPTGETRAMPIGELMQHAAVHGVHHRGQIALALQLLGHDPGYFDILLYHAERRGVPVW